MANYAHVQSFQAAYPTKPDVSLVARLLCVAIVFAPLFSGARAIDPTIGRLLLLAFDLLVVGVAVLSKPVRQVLPLKISIAVCLLLYASHFLLRTDLPSLDVLSQGLRKSLMFPIAILVGANFSGRDAKAIGVSIVVALVLVGLYAIKQLTVGYSDFDYRLLGEQAAGMYTNLIDGRQRAISFLSSGFHVGFAACVLGAYAIFQTNWRPVLRIALFSIAAIACFASLTRTFQVIFVLMCLAAVFGRLHLYVKVLCVILAIAIVATGAPFELLSAIYSDQRFLGRSSSYEDFEWYTINAPWGAVFGFGPGSAGSALQDPFLQASAPWIEPHNILLKYLFELGWPLGLILIAVCVLIARPIVGQGSKVALWCAVALVVSGMFITSVEASPISIYVGIIIGLAIRSETTKPSLVGGGGAS